MCTSVKQPTGRAISSTLPLKVLHHSTMKEWRRLTSPWSLSRCLRCEWILSHITFSLQRQTKCQSPCHRVQLLCPQLFRQKVTILDRPLLSKPKHRIYHFIRKDTSALQLTWLCIPVQANQPFVWWTVTTAARVESRSSTKLFGGQCAMMTGTCTTPTWCVGNLAAGQLAQQRPRPTSAMVLVQSC